MQELPPGFQLDQPSPTPQRAPGVIRGPAPTIDPVEAARLNNDNARLGIAFDRERREAEKDAREREELAQLESDIIAKEREVLEDTIRRIDLIDEVYGDANDSALAPGLGEVGFWGARLQDVEGTAAFDLSKKMTPILAVQAIDKLLEVKSDPRNPTGGAFGQLSNKELDLLKGYIGDLSQGQSIEEFNRQLGRIKRAALDIVQKMDPERAQEIVNRGSPSFNEDGSITYDERGKALFGIEGGGDNPPPTDGGPGFAEQFATGIAQGTGDAVQGVGDTVGIFTRPVSGLIADALGYDGSQMETFGTTLRKTAGLPQSAPGIGRTAREAAAGALTFGGVTRGVANALAPGVMKNSFAVAGRTPVRDTVAGAGAGAGAVVGEEAGGTVGQVAGMLAGGLGGYGAANAATSLMQIGKSAPNALGQASARQGVDLLPADAGGDAIGILTSGARISPVSAGPIRSAARKNQEQMNRAANAAIADAPEGVTTDVAGQSVRNSAVRYTEETGRRGNALYERAYRLADRVKSIRPVETIAAIDSQLARLKQNPANNQQAISELEGFKNNISGGASIQGLREARTQLSQGVYDGKLRSGSEKAMWKDILGNIKGDITTALRSVGKDDAANAFETADAFWAARVEHLDQVLEPLVDPKKGGEQIIETIESMARGRQGGNARLSRLLGNMSPSEAAGVRGTIVNRLGKANPGAQDATGEAFSPATFLTNWNKLTPQAKTSLFQGEQRQALDDLALLAENMKASQRMANHSNTALALTGSGNAVAGTAIAAATHPVFALIAGGVQYGSGKLFASPEFARLLTRTAKLPSDVANRQLTEQLQILATKQPAIGAEARAVVQAINDNARLAAQDGEQQN